MVKPRPGRRGARAFLLRGVVVPKDHVPQSVPCVITLRHYPAGIVHVYDPATRQLVQAEHDTWRRLPLTPLTPGAWRWPGPLCARFTPARKCESVEGEDGVEREWPARIAGPLGALPLSSTSMPVEEALHNS
jgi:hypothetical protein